VFDVELLRKRGFIECFTGFIVYDDREFENGLNRVLLVSDFQQYFELKSNTEGKIIRVLMDKDHIDMNPSPEEMKLHFFIWFNAIELDINVLLVDQQ